MNIPMRHTNKRAGRKPDEETTITPDRVKAIIDNALRGGGGLETTDTASVYVMEAGSRSVKIGVSKSVGKRVSTIQVGQPENTTVYWAITLERKQAYAVEKAAHEELERRGLRVRGEWFWVEPDDAVLCIIGRIRRAGFKSSPHLAYGLHRSAG